MLVTAEVSVAADVDVAAKVSGIAEDSVAVEVPVSVDVPVAEGPVAAEDPVAAEVPVAEEAVVPVARDTVVDPVTPSVTVARSVRVLTVGALDASVSVRTAPVVAALVAVVCTAVSVGAELLATDVCMLSTVVL